MSVDPVIQSPGNSQSLNPYSYIMNNPLAGTDPSGYMGCAASKIESVCAKTDANHGGSASPASSLVGSVSSGAGKGNGAQQNQQQTQVNQQNSAVDTGSQKNAASVQGENSRVNGGQSGEGTSTGCQTSIDCRGRGNGYDKSDAYYHVYSMMHSICSTNVSSCTVENVYSSLSKNAAPGSDGKTSISADKETEIQMAGVSGGHVSHLADKGNFRIVNMTNDDHIFHNGLVIRSVVSNEGMISIRTYGEGVNRTNWIYMPDRVSWAANYLLASPGFRQQDSNIRQQVLSLSHDGKAVLRQEAQFKQQVRDKIMRGPKY